MGKKIWRIVLSGTGGQGLISGGNILAHAAVLDGMKAAQTESYSSAQRGGGSDSGVVLGWDEIVYPGVIAPDILVVMAPLALEKYKTKLHADSLVLYDSTIGEIDLPENVKKLAYPLTAIAREIGGSIPPVNMVALGIIVKCRQIVTPESFIRAIEKHFSNVNVAENNKKAFWKGYSLNIF